MLWAQTQTGQVGFETGTAHTLPCLELPAPKFRARRF
jgi:hypothetical protein